MVTPSVHPPRVGGCSVRGGDRRQPGADACRPERPLVSSSISQHTFEDHLQLFPVSLKVRRPSSARVPAHIPDRSGSTISGFSPASRRRLRFTAINAFPQLISQFGLTYHDQWPTDGRTCKGHLNAWLTSVRRILPGVGYLWIMEFQRRGAPHFHVFLSVPPDEPTRIRLADAWCRITSPGDAAALAFHRHRENWIPWEMRQAGYLAKYLDKDAQKAIPEGYGSFGRFWGCTRGLVPAPVEVPLTELDEATTTQNYETGEVSGGTSTVLRWLGRLAEKQTRGISRFRKRAQRYSYTMLEGARAYSRIEQYLCNQRQAALATCPF